jgi:hypothetical protein
MIVDVKQRRRKVLKHPSIHHTASGKGKAAIARGAVHFDFMAVTGPMAGPAIVIPVPTSLPTIHQHPIRNNIKSDMFNSHPAAERTETSPEWALRRDISAV